MTRVARDVREEPDIAVSVVIPVFGSAETLNELYDRLSSVLRAESLSYEIILVDDASRDSSWNIMCFLHEKDNAVKILQHMKNFGQHRAILCGMRYAQGRLVVTMDDDLQHPPEEIPKLLHAIQKRGDDVVIGRYNVKQHGRIRNLATRVNNMLASRIIGKDPELRLTSFRVLRAEVAYELTRTRTCHPRIGQLLLTITDRISNVAVAHHRRKHGRSGYSRERLVSDALTNVLGTSSLPLRIVSIGGFVCSTLSFALGCLTLLRYLVTGVSVTGWTSIILVQLFFFGISLLSFGVVGEYLIRIMGEVRDNSETTIRHKRL